MFPAAGALRADPAAPGAQPEERPDLLVVGLGPGGASAAAAAASAGCRVLAVDRRRRIGEPVQCAEFVSSAFSIEGFSWERIETQRVVRMVTAVQAQRPRVSEDFRGRMICRSAFDQALARRAAAAGAHIRLGVAVCEVRVDGGVRLSSGELIRPRALVGADGPRSRVGAAIGQSNRQLVAARQFTVGLRQPYEATDIFLSSAYPGGYAWLFPKGSAANLGVGVDFHRRDRLKPLLRDLHASLAADARIRAAPPSSTTGGLIPVGGRLRAIGALGAVSVLLAGDAAGLTHPVTGAGIEAAVYSGVLAGRAVASWLAGHCNALQEYENDLSDLYDPAYARALRRRRELLRGFGRGVPAAEALWRGWIASPEYWSDAAGPSPDAAAPPAQPLMT